MNVVDCSAMSFRRVLPIATPATTLRVRDGDVIVDARGLDEDGQVETWQYRFLGRHQGWTEIETGTAVSARWLTPLIALALWWSPAPGVRPREEGALRWRDPATSGSPSGWTAAGGYSEAAMALALRGLEARGRLKVQRALGKPVGQLDVQLTDRGEKVAAQHAGAEERA